MEQNWPLTQVCETLQDIGREVARELRKCRTGRTAEPFPKWWHCSDHSPGFHAGRVRSSVCRRTHK